MYYLPRHHGPIPAVGVPPAGVRGGLAGWLVAVVQTARPRQWPKNLLVFAAPLAGASLGRANGLGYALVAAAVFVVASCAVYSTVANFIAGSSLSCVQVRTPQQRELESAVIAAGGAVQPGADGDLEVRGLEVAEVGEIAYRDGILLQLLAPAHASLEEAFMALTADSLEFHAAMEA